MTMILSDFPFPSEVFKLILFYSENEDCVFRCQFCHIEHLRPKRDYSNCVFCNSDSCDECVVCCACGCKQWVCLNDSETCAHCEQSVCSYWSCWIRCSYC